MRPVGHLRGTVRLVRRDNFLGVVAPREADAVAAARTLRAVWTPPDRASRTRAQCTHQCRPRSSHRRSLETTGNAGQSCAQSRAHARGCNLSDAVSIPRIDWPLVRSRRRPWWRGHHVVGHAGRLRAPRDPGRALELDPSRIHVYGRKHRAATATTEPDDAASDAAILSQAVEAPVRVQWSRQDELGWDPKGPAMLMECAGAVDADGAIAAWDYTVTTPTHSTRPDGEPGQLLAGQLMGAPLTLGAGGGDRNARHLYHIPNNRVAVRWLHTSVLRPSAMRGLGAPANVFAIESFLDELAVAAGADPVEFRLRHLTDPRAVAVVKRVAELAQWQPEPASTNVPPTTSRTGIASGRGIAFAQYETAYTYVATVVDVEVERHTGAIRVRRAWVAHDCGLIVNPNGLRNQIEGATVQTISRALKERVTWDRRGRHQRRLAILPDPDLPRSPGLHRGRAARPSRSTRMGRGRAGRLHGPGGHRQCHLQRDRRPAQRDPVRRQLVESAPLSTFYFLSFYSPGRVAPSPFRTSAFPCATTAPRRPWTRCRTRRPRVPGRVESPGSCPSIR